MEPNSLRQKLKDRRKVLGTAIQQSRCTEVMRIIGSSGLDFVWIDTEHGAFHSETTHDLIGAAHQSRITPLVRVADMQYSLVARTLDSGAQGIIFPRVDDAAALREAISWTKFPPVGKRGFGIGLPHLGYKPAAFDEIIRHHNEQNMVVAQIETAEALENAEELLSVEHLDAVLVGPADLSISLGVAGQFENAKLVTAVRRVIDLCEKHQVIPGIHVRNMELANNWAERGMRLVSVGSESTLLFEKLTAIVGEAKAWSS